MMCYKPLYITCCVGVSIDSLNAIEDNVAMKWSYLNVLYLIII